MESVIINQITDYNHKGNMIKNLEGKVRNGTCTEKKDASGAVASKNSSKVSEKKAVFDLKPRNGYFDSGKIKVLDDVKVKDGILVFYFTEESYCLGAALFDKKNNKLVYRTANPIFKSEDKLSKIKIRLLKDGNIEFSFTKNGKSGKEIFSLDYVLGRDKNKIKEKPSLVIKSIIKKADNNPIIAPKFENKWESCGTFNPAVVEIDGLTHILYRAVGDDGGSVIGYAVSKDGIHIDERLSYPIYRPREHFEIRINAFQPVFSYNSGPNYDCWGGCEDPRVVRIGDILYMLYTAFNGITPPCVAITSIKVCDFLDRKWDKWKRPTLLSPKNKMNKNWVIFPEKINGKYAVLHSITPSIQIEYLDTLDFKENPNIKSVYIQYKNKGVWDTVVRGVGPTPLRIEDGWLVFYHAISDKEPGRYKIGAMILDYDNPTRILYKSSFPIIEPDKKYENEGYKGGIVYTCGAVIKGEDIILYYGGADTVVCAASCNLKNFIQQIKDNNGKI